MLVGMKIGVVIQENNLEVSDGIKNGYTLSPCEFFQTEHMEGCSSRLTGGRTGLWPPRREWMSKEALDT